jgi:hypothetical protein
MSPFQPVLGPPCSRFSCGTHSSTFPAHLAFSLPFVCPNHINCHLCTSSIMSFPISIVSLIVSFLALSNLVLLHLLRRQSISAANSLFLFFLLTSHACTPCTVTPRSFSLLDAKGYQYTVSVLHVQDLGQLS